MKGILRDPAKPGGKKDPAFRLRSLLQRAQRKGARILVMGIGNELLGDDAVGVLIAQDLTGLNSETFLSVPVGISVENASHLVRRHRADLVILLDAASGIGGEDWAFVPTSRLDTFCHSTHSLPLYLFVRIWKEDNPALDVRFIGITPQESTFKDGLSPVVDACRKGIVEVFHGVFGALGKSHRKK